MPFLGPKRDTLEPGLVSADLNVDTAATPVNHSRHTALLTDEVATENLTFHARSWVRTHNTDLKHTPRSVVVPL